MDLKSTAWSIHWIRGISHILLAGVYDKGRARYKLLSNIYLSQCYRRRLVPYVADLEGEISYFFGYQSSHLRLARLSPGDPPTVIL